MNPLAHARLVIFMEQCVLVSFTHITAEAPSCWWRTDGRKTEANTNPPLSVSMCFSKTQTHTSARTAETHTGMCFALIHNGMTLTFPPSYFTHAHRQNNADKSDVSLRPSRNRALPSCENAAWMSIPELQRIPRSFALGHSVRRVSSQNERWTGRALLCVCVFLSQANSSKCWGLFIKVTMINNDWCCNYKPIAALFDEEF